MPKHRLSYSALEQLRDCERKFQLNRLLAGSEQREETEHLSFGHAFGAGVQSYLQYQDADRALYDAWLAYWPILETDAKSQARCLAALMHAFSKMDTLLLEWELAFFDSRPATELSFRVEIDSDYYYVGYVDAVLKNRFTGQYIVLETKTTGLALTNLAPLYQNSGQALSYSIVLDRVAGEAQASYGVLYFVAQMKRDFNDINILPMHFDKTLLDRLNWFITLGLDVKHLHEMAELGCYPMRGGSCLSFMRPCFHFGTCHLHGLDTPKQLEEDDIEYQFCYDLNDLVDEHLARVYSQSQQPVRSNTLLTVEALGSMEL